MKKYENREMNKAFCKYEERTLCAENISFTQARQAKSYHRPENDIKPQISMEYNLSASDCDLSKKEGYGKASHSEKLLSQAIQGEYTYGKLGLILGLGAIIGGVVLCLNGVAGSTSWTASVLGMKSEISDAVPGVVLFIVGLFMIWVTKPNVNFKNLKG